MRSFFLSALLLFCYLPLLFAETISPVIFAHKTDVPVVIDGVLDDICWTQAIRISGFLDMSDNSKFASPQTFVQVAYDENNLYFGITGVEPDIAFVNRRPFEKDSWPSGTSFEIFLDTNSDRATYYQFATNLGGGIFDSYNKDTKWDGNWQVASEVLKDRWVLEIAVPFSDFAMDSPIIGARWGLNFCRNREGGIKYSSSWAPVGRDFHNPGKFSTLVFGNSKEWLLKEIRDYTLLRDEFQLFLKGLALKEKRLEAKLARSGNLMKRIQRIRITDRTGIQRILPIYEQIQKINVICQDIDDEIKVLKVLLEQRDKNNL